MSKVSSSLFCAFLFLFIALSMMSSANSKVIKSETTRNVIGKCGKINGNQLYEKGCRDGNTICCLRVLNCRVQGGQGKCMQN